MSDLVQIDGSYGEGGGQILRTSLSLAALTGRPVEILNIRAKRSRPGLQPQHLAAVRAGASICGASLRGDAAGSVHLVVETQHESRAGEYHFDIGTAGATTLVAQTVMVPLSFARGPSRVTIKGGTHNPMAPTADYLANVYIPALAELGFKFEAAYAPAGFYPRGGGLLVVEVGEMEEAGRASFMERTASPLMATITSNNLPPAIADRGEAVLKRFGTIEVKKRIEEALSSGIAVTIHTAHAGFSSLGERGKPMEKVAGEAVDQLKDWLDSGAAVDEHLADQLVLPSLFANGESRWRANRVTEHLRTVLWVARQFCEFDYELDEDSGTVRVSPINMSG